MDPITAIFNFLSTPAGQKLAGGADDVFGGVIKDLIVLFHHKAVPLQSTTVKIP